MRLTKKIIIKKVNIDETAFLRRQLSFDKHPLKQVRFQVEFALQVSKGLTSTYVMLCSSAREFTLI